MSDAINFRLKQCQRVPRGVRCVERSKISSQIRFWQFEVLIFSQNWKNAKNAKNDLKNHCFWPYFGSLLSFSWILALQTKTFVFSTNFCNFWHPGHPWERIRSGDILVFVLLFKILEQWRHLVTFLHCQNFVRCPVYCYYIMNITFSNNWIEKVKSKKKNWVAKLIIRR